MSQVFEVVILRDAKNQTRPVSEFYVAESMKDVISALELELSDESCEVIKIEAKAPILRILP